ncbi:hypothetical protein [Nostoc sp. NZL]|uniref:hypothetical protein n=1 Tax=Nostoc sp. NZL TaxID=2650612 RepID=UPI0018C7C1F6|nr:hypothetical protein [Nostoc sp. NZL]
MLNQFGVAILSNSWNVQLEKPSQSISAATFAKRLAKILNLIGVAISSKNWCVQIEKPSQ